MLINIFEPTISDASLQHTKSGDWNRPDITFGNAVNGSGGTSSRKNACFYCSDGHNHLTYSYKGQGSEDKFACHNFACQNNTNTHEPMNCDMHGSSEWINP